MKFTEPPLASLLATGGNLVFVPDARGWLHAYNAETGQELWSFNNGLGHNGGIISYSAKGKQYDRRGHRLGIAGRGRVLARSSASRSRACRRTRAPWWCSRWSNRDAGRVGGSTAPPPR